jgi:3-phosphoshikimate 1-carboxyvinyltransferase
MIAPTLQKGLILHLKGEIVSRSYINLTIQLMKEFGADVHWDSDTCIIVNPTSYHNIPYSVESDWSAASYWYEIAALMPKTIIRLSELKEKSYQGDKRVTDVFDRLGVQTDFTDEGVIIRHTEHKTNMFTDNFSDIPDLAQTVIVTCCLLHVPFRIDGLRTLKIKETDRIEALKKELFKLGYIINDENGGDVLSGDGKQFPIDNVPIIETYEDHRMAMAFAPTSIITSNVQINNPIVVNKSYVEYWSDLRKAGFTIKTI